ncbi:hypothetical protein [Afipia sp. DC4300-2b1]|uniref:hypothetical protein n=1 Tax=Afipia sp. DC4300-2b1 TaxID=2804672 RepID=UPI003CEC3E68
MSILSKFFGGKTAITADAIRTESARTTGEIAAHRAKLEGALVGIALMNDEEHQKAEADIAATRRTIARLEARLAHLDSELPAVIAAEETASKNVADAVLVARSDAAREANTKEAAKLLKDYDKLAAQIGDIISRLKDMSEETAAVNTALRTNPLAATVASYHDIHRKSPDQPASEVCEMRPHWIYRDAPTRPDEIAATIQEYAILASLDESGNPIRPAGNQRGRFGQVITPQLEKREVVTQTRYRPGRSEVSLDAIHLPPGFAGGASHWPRG